MKDDEHDIWALDEVHFQQYGSCCRMWIPPEVTEPVGVKNPVLAWGLGLERLAMLKFGVNDIRSLYISDVDWLKKVSLI